MLLLYHLVYHAPQLETFEVPRVVPRQTTLIYIAYLEMPQTDKFYHTGTEPAHVDSGHNFGRCQEQYEPIKQFRAISATWNLHGAFDTV